MGQGGSVSENKSIILSNWTQTKPNSTTYYNKVTNQQIQRHEVVINDKHQLSSYVHRMQNQSQLICRLIYFHPKVAIRDDTNKKSHLKNNNDQRTCEIRPKSFIEQGSIQNHTNKLTTYTLEPVEEEHFVNRVYCLYTDRMIPIKQWSKKKVIDILQAFKKLVQIYGLFKVREYCICENQRREVKVWINQNPVSNFPLESVQSEEDMIADFAALLVSKKQKIAKQLLDFQRFDHAIQHLTELNEQQFKKFANASKLTNEILTRQNDFLPIVFAQKNPIKTLPSQINKSQNLLNNFDNQNSTTQNDKFVQISQVNFNNHNFTQSLNTQKNYQENSVNNKEQPVKISQKYKKISQLDAKPQSQYIHTVCQAQSQTEGSSNLKKLDSNFNFSRQTTISDQHLTKQPYHNQQRQNFTEQFYEKNEKGDDQQQIQNTSILMCTKDNSGIIKSGMLIKKNETQTALKQQKSVRFIDSSASLHSESNQNQSLKVNSLIPKFIASSNQQKNIRSKNNSSGNIQIKKNSQFEKGETNYNLGTSSKNQTSLLGYKTNKSKQCSSEQVSVKDQQFNSGNNSLRKEGVNRVALISQLSTMKSPNSQSNTYNTSKKSFPKYFQQKKNVEGIQKQFKNNNEQNQNITMIKKKIQSEKSPFKYKNAFTEPNYQFYQEKYKIKDFTQQVVPEVQQSQVCSKQVLPPPTLFNKIVENSLKKSPEKYEPRKKFPSTTQYKTKNVQQTQSVEQMSIRQTKTRTEVDSQQTLMNKNQMIKLNFMQSRTISNEGQKQVKKSNNSVFGDSQQNKFTSITKTYFNHINSSNHLFAFNQEKYPRKKFSTDFKRRFKIQSLTNEDQGRSSQLYTENKYSKDTSHCSSKNGPLLLQFDKQSLNDQNRDCVVDEQNNRKLTYPSHPYHNKRTNQKQFTFFGTQKLAALDPIEQLKLYVANGQNNRVYTKKQSINSADENQTLPRTTADEKEKKFFKSTRTSEPFIDSRDLYSSDSGYKANYRANLGLRDKMLESNEVVSFVQKKQGFDKQQLKFKKWQPSTSIYASLITHEGLSATSKKNLWGSSQKEKLIVKQRKSTKQQKQKTVQQESQNPLINVNKQNIQTKKKIRKQVLMDYKGLFGDEEQQQQAQTEKEKQSQKKLEVKKRKEEDERLLQNNSSKDLLIQEKVQKQKEKHAQLKSDLSKLFNQEI